MLRKQSDLPKVIWPGLGSVQARALHHSTALPTIEGLGEPGPEGRLPGLLELVALPVIPQPSDSPVSCPPDGQLTQACSSAVPSAASLSRARGPEGLAVKPQASWVEEEEAQGNPRQPGTPLGAICRHRAFGRVGISPTSRSLCCLCRS